MMKDSITATNTRQIESEEYKDNELLSENSCSGHFLSSKHVIRLSSLIRHLFPSSKGMESNISHSSASESKYIGVKSNNRKQQVRSSFQIVENIEKVMNERGNILTLRDIKEYKIGAQPYYMDNDGDIANEFYEVMKDKYGNETLVKLCP